MFQPIPWSMACLLAGCLGLPEGYITEEDHEGVGLQFYAAILAKPGS